MAKLSNEELMLNLTYGVLGAVFATVFSSFGAAYGTARAGKAVSDVAVMRPDLIMKSLVPIIMAGILAIYGLVISVLISNDIKKDRDVYSLYKGLTHFGGGLSVGLNGLAAGMAIGIVGDSGVRGTAHEPRLFVGMILMLIFAEVLGLYGMIIAIFFYAE